MRALDLWAAGLLLAALPSPTPAQVTASLPAPRPRAVVDLRTAEGAALVKAQWRYRDVSIVEVDPRSGKATAIERLRVTQDEADRLAGVPARADR